MTDTTKYLTKEKYKDLEKELLELKTVKRKEVAVSLEYARSLGDLSENAEYQEAKEAQSLNESNIQDLEEMLRDVVVIQKPTSSSNVQIGSTIEVESTHGKEMFTIVGSEEADPLSGKISNESPLGRAFLGHAVGDAVGVKTPGGQTSYKVKKIL